MHALAENQLGSRAKTPVMASLPPYSRPVACPAFKAQKNTLFLETSEEMRLGVLCAHARSGGDASQASHLGSEDHAITEEGLAAATAAPPSTAATPSTHILVSSHTRNCCVSNARATREKRPIPGSFLDLGNTQARWRADGETAVARVREGQGRRCQQGSVSSLSRCLVACVKRRGIRVPGAV
jgi:hypothetical protein